MIFQQVVVAKKHLFFLKGQYFRSLLEDLSSKQLILHNLKLIFDRILNLQKNQTGSTIQSLKKEILFKPLLRKGTVSLVKGYDSLIKTYHIVKYWIGKSGTIFSESLVRLRTVRELKGIFHFIIEPFGVFEDTSETSDLSSTNIDDVLHTVVAAIDGAHTGECTRIETVLDALGAIGHALRDAAALR